MTSGSCEAPVPTEPREGTLDDPAAGEHLEAFCGLGRLAVDNTGAGKTVLFQTSTGAARRSQGRSDPHGLPPRRCPIRPPSKRPRRFATTIASCKTSPNSDESRGRARSQRRDVIAPRDATAERPAGAPSRRHRGRGQAARPHGRRCSLGDRGRRRAALSAARSPRLQPDRNGRLKPQSPTLSIRSAQRHRPLASPHRRPRRFSSTKRRNAFLAAGYDPDPLELPRVHGVENPPITKLLPLNGCKLMQIRLISTYGILHMRCEGHPSSQMVP